MGREEKIRKIVREVLKESYDLEEYPEVDAPFSPTLPEDVKKRSKRYEGRNVIWYGDPGSMIVLSADQVHGMWGNIYYPEKKEYLKDLIINYPEKVEIECSYGIGDVITIQDIIDQQTSASQDSFQVDYEELDEPATTGDEELDHYAGIEYIDHLEWAGDISEDARKFFEEHKFDLVYGKSTPESLAQQFKLIDPDEYDREAFNEFIRLEMGLNEAKESNQGDINEFEVQLRDGHHRVMSAIESGEEYVCLNLTKEGLERFKGYYNAVV